MWLGFAQDRSTLTRVYTTVYIGSIDSIVVTPRFEDWLRGLKDAQGRASILARIRRLSLGNMGDIKSVGKGIYELRIHTGPGYRVYLSRRSREAVILLVGGDKGSQSSDIKDAKILAEQYQEES